MNRLLLLFAISFTFLGSGCAPLKPFVYQPNHKKYEDGKLAWSDFKGKPMAVTNLSSELIYFFFYKPERVKTRDTTFYKLRSYAFIDRDQSWVFDTAKTDLNLKGNQWLFSSIELRRRMLENRFLTMANLQEAEKIYINEQRLLREEYARFAVETKGGRDSAQVAAWQARTNRQLDSVKTFIPKFTKANFGFGSHFGYSSARLKDNFSGTFSGFKGLDVGFDLDIHDFRIVLSSQMGSGETLKAHHGTYDWPSGMDVNLFRLGLLLGYPVVNASRFRVIPMAGPTSVKLFPNVTAGENFEGQAYQDNVVALGLQLDWKFWNEVNLMVPGKYTFADCGLQTRIIYYPAAFSQNLQGRVFDLSFSFFVNSRKILLKR